MENYKTCDCCKYGAIDKTVTGENNYQCRRYAPKPDMTKKPVNWPIVLGSYWCGEFASKS